MFYSYNDFGWYAGEVPNGSPRSVPTPPALLDIHTEPGRLRSFFDGFDWQQRPYAQPPAQSSDDAPTYSDAVLYKFINMLDKEHNVTENDVDALINAMPAGRDKRKMKAWWGRGPLIERGTFEFRTLRDLVGLTNRQFNRLLTLANDDKGG